jgi:tRNA(fMet)-specific endonuclease VapC
MSLYVLDTDILTLYAEGDAAVARRVSEHPPDQVAITVLTVEEQLSGWYTQVRKAKNPERLAQAYYELARSVRFLGRLPILLYTEEAIRRYNELRKQKSVSGGPTCVLPPPYWSMEALWSRATSMISAA